MRKKNIVRMAGVIMSAVLTVGTIGTQSIFATEYKDAYEDTYEQVEHVTEVGETGEDVYQPNEPTGWFVEVPESEDSENESGQSIIEEHASGYELTDGTLVQATDLTEESVYNALISMKSVYPEGMRWTNANSYGPYYHYGNVTYTGFGCAGFAFHLSNTAFGDLQDREHYNWDDIRIGDILRVNDDTHSVIVLDVDGDNITVAEGNYNSSIHWGRVLSRKSLKSGMGTYIWTRWPEGSTPSTVTSITLSETSVYTEIGDLFVLSATVRPTTASNRSVTWSSSNPGVATVKSNGLVSVVGTGTAVITCTSVQNNSVTATCTINSVDYAKLEAFATRLYNKCLNREPDEDGLEHWVEVLANGSRSGADVGKGFVFSKEYQLRNATDEEFVETLYNVFLDRASDTAGKAHWVDLLSQGLSREYVFRGFAQSKEYTQICASYGITRGNVTLTQARDQNPNLTKYVNRCYTQALNRLGEEDGLNHWCTVIQTGTKTSQQVAEAFINSAEFKNKKLSDEEYVKVLYRTFMGREYDQAGLKHWLDELNKGCSRENILARFAGSAEFKNIQASFGL